MCEPSTLDCRPTSPVVRCCEVDVPNVGPPPLLLPLPTPSPVARCREVDVPGAIDPIHVALDALATELVMVAL